MNTSEISVIKDKEQEVIEIEQEKEEIVYTQETTPINIDQVYSPFRDKTKDQAQDKDQDIIIDFNVINLFKKDDKKIIFNIYKNDALIILSLCLLVYMFGLRNVFIFLIIGTSLYSE